MGIAIEAAPGALVPYATVSAQSSDVQTFLYMQLADIAADLQTYVPRLAEGWSWGDDHRTLEVQLRPGLRWEDGEPLTSRDVHFTFELTRDPRVGWIGIASKSRIRECEVIDPLTVRFHFTETYPDQFMDANVGFIVPYHHLHDVPRERWSEEAPERGPVGCGPFRLESAGEGHITLARNPLFHEPGRPYLERVRFEVIPDPAERLSALREGRVDLLPQVPERDAAALRQAHEAGLTAVGVQSIRGRMYDFVCYNPRHPALADREVRRALTLATDRRAIIRMFCSGFAEPLESPIVPVVWAFDADLPITPYDPRSARALLERQGWHARCDQVREKDGVKLEISLLTNSDNARRVGVAQVLAEYWNSVGVGVEVQLLGRREVLQRLDRFEYEAAISGWRARLSPDLEPMWGCSSVGSKLNRVHYCNPEVDRLNRAALRTHDREEARGLLHRAQRLIAQDHPYTWLYYLHDVVGVRERLQGALFDARAVFINPHEWWATPEATRRPRHR
ncbi:MAG: ABC transporter substrate-binding protein [Candidatus Krumholzibacteriia bacterium]